MVFSISRANHERQYLLPKRDYVLVAERRDDDTVVAHLCEHNSSQSYPETTVASIRIGSTSLPRLKASTGQLHGFQVEVLLVGAEEKGVKPIQLTAFPGHDNSPDDVPSLDLRHGDTFRINACETQFEVNFSQENSMEIQIGSSVPASLHGIEVQDSGVQQSQPDHLAIIQQEHDEYVRTKTPRLSRTRSDKVEETPTTRGKSFFNAIESSVVDNSTYNTAPDTDASSITPSSERMADSPSVRRKLTRKRQVTPLEQEDVVNPDAEPRVSFTTSVSAITPEDFNSHLDSGANISMPEGEASSGVENDSNLIELHKSQCLDQDTARDIGMKPLSQDSTASWTRKKRTRNDKPARIYGKRRKLTPRSEPSEKDANAQVKSRVVIQSKVESTTHRGAANDSAAVNDVRPSSRSNSLSEHTPVQNLGTDKSERLEVVLSGSEIAIEADATYKHFREACVVSEHVSSTTDILCLGGKEIKTTPKALLATVLGKWILSDEWIKTAARYKSLPNPGEFVLRDTKFSNKYGRSIKDIHGAPLPNLFAGKTIYITPALKKEYRSGYQEVENILMMAGASQVVCKAVPNLSTIGGKKTSMSDVIVIGADAQDEQLAKLDNGNVTFYHRDFISSCIFAGSLLLDEEHLKIRPKSMAKRGRKSG